MQEVKYPQLNIQETEQSELEEEQSQIINSNQNTSQSNHNQIFIPAFEVNQNQNPCQQNTIQPIKPFQNQVQPYINNYNQNQPDSSDDNLNQSLIQNQIKYLDFSQQKEYLSFITWLFFLWYCLDSLFWTVIFAIFGNSIYNYKLYKPFLLIFSAIMLCHLNKIGLEKKHRNNSIKFFFMIIIFYTLIDFTLIGSLGSDITSDVTCKYPLLIVVLSLIWIGLKTAQYINFYTTVIMIIYLRIENQRIFIEKFVCVTLLINVLIFLVFNRNYYLLLQYLLLSMPYTILLPKSLQQITRGRYKLQKDQVFSGALAANYGLFIFWGQEV